MHRNLEAVKKLAKDLNKEDPRSPDEELAGFPLGARCLDKCRASLVGSQGDYIYGCPMDQEFLASAGIDAASFKEYVATGAADSEVEHWIEERVGRAE